ncbi:MAG: putative toxin-antitoxin system toxin component, PIN family [Gemmatimonadota bacterium]|nr:putative toxin-antitoxin system toxin component, PIN family [Gemmatimonadota bacterium]
MRVFIDTNVLASAFATRGICSDVLGIVVAEHDLLVSEQVLSELGRTLRGKFRTPEDLAREVETFLREEAIVVGDAPLLDIEVRDADDKRIVEQAVAGGAELLVTGDRDLIDMKAGRPLRILTPRGFWEFVRAGP